MNKGKRRPLVDELELLAYTMIELIFKNFQKAKFANLSACLRTALERMSSLRRDAADIPTAEEFELNLSVLTEEERHEFNRLLKLVTSSEKPS